jgi:GGDEF domain-containing protein
MSPEAAAFGLPQIAISTLAAVLMIGLGFLPRPGRATLIWSMTYFLALIFSSLTVVAEQLHAEALRRVMLGALLTPQVLIWAGLRAWRGVPSRALLVLPFGVLSALVLAIVPDGVPFGVAFRVVFLGAGAFAVLAFVELRRIPERRHRMLLPLAVVSLAFGAIAVVGAIAPLALPASAVADLTLTRNINTVGMIVNVVCSLVSLLWLAQRAAPQLDHDPAFWQHFSTIARDRLARAGERNERSWSLLSIDLDDARDLRQAWGEAMFSEVADAFHARVCRAFPAEADIGRRAADRAVVLVPGGTEALRERVRVLLSDVVSMDLEVGTTVRLSASVGWASVSDSGYDFDVLLAAADGALAAASAQGGDRWLRVPSATDA